jgi:hypothetical protein
VLQAWPRLCESGGSTLPVAENVEQPVAGFGLDRFRWESTQSPNRLAHLLQVRAAPGALRQLRFEPQASAVWQSMLEVIRDELYELLPR